MIVNSRARRLVASPPIATRPLGAGKTSAVDALLTCIEGEGVEHIFGVPGASLTPIYESLSMGRASRQILAKHEEGAAFMAAAYARVRRGLGVCCATTGPGGTNSLTGIASAYADSLPVLLLTGQSPTRFFDKGAFQESSPFGIDLVKLFMPVTKLSVMIPSADRVFDITRHAIRVALSGRPGPVHLNIPGDFLKEPVDDDLSRAREHLGRVASVDRGMIAAVAELLLHAQHPAILAGHGVSLSDGAEELLQLAELLHVPIATTPKAKGIFPEDHQLSLGVFGFAGHARADAYLLSDYIDVLVIIGTSLGEWSTNAWNINLRPEHALIQIDIDPTIIGRNYPVDIGVVGDAKAALQELGLHVELMLRERPTMLEDRSLDPLALLRHQIPRYVGLPVTPPRPSLIKPQHLAQDLQQALPEDAMLFVDIGNAMTWGGHYMEIRRPHTYFVALGLASMGSATAGAIGGSLAAPGRSVVALVGDGAFAMNGMEVHTAVEYGLPVVWVVLNNSGHGMIKHGERLLLGDHLGACEFRVPLNIYGLSVAMGARAFIADTREGFKDALADALASNLPCVIDAKIDPEEVPSSLARRAQTLKAGFDHLPLSMRQPAWPKGS